MEKQGNVIDLTAEFARRGQRPSLPQSSPTQVALRITPTISFPQSVVRHAPETMTDSEIRTRVHEGLSSEELIEDAVQALFDRYDQEQMAEFTGLTDEGRAELEAEQEASLALLSDEERDIAMTRFNALIEPGPPKAS